MKDLDKIAARHAGIVTPALFNLDAQDSVSRRQLCDVVTALGLDPEGVAGLWLAPDGITAEVMRNGQTALEFWPVK